MEIHNMDNKQNAEERLFLKIGILFENWYKMYRGVWGVVEEVG